MCVDGLTGFPDAIETVYPKAKIQLCIVHMMRNSLNFVSWKQRKAVAADLKRIYKSTTVDDAERELDAFCERRDDPLPTIGLMWRRHWHNLIALYDYPMEIRKIIYTTNAIESLNSLIRKPVRKRKLFPNERAACPWGITPRSKWCILRRWTRRRNGSGQCGTGRRL
ncbi:MAG: transposase [Gammaproteobacteria bacterium]